MDSPTGGGAYTGTKTKADLDNHSNQLNPNHSEYRGSNPGTHTKSDLDNHGQQLNPNNPKYQSPKK